MVRNNRDQKIDSDRKIRHIVCIDHLLLLGLLENLTVDGIVMPNFPTGGSDVVYVCSTCARYNGTQTRIGSVSR